MADDEILSTPPRVVAVGEDGESEDYLEAYFRSKDSGKAQTLLPRQPAGSN